MRRILSRDERKRARQFFFDEDRDHYVLARGLLRLILARYLDVDPGRLRFDYNTWGKPALGEPGGSQWLNFNLSHSGDLALYAVARGRRVGVDLERMRDDVSFELLAKRFFSPREYAVLQAIPAGAKKKAFFDGWTRKEAYIKARGKGLSIPLEQFDVSLAPDEPARLLGNEMDPDDVSRWSLQEIAPAGGYAAAIAVEGRDWHVACFDLAEAEPSQA